MAGEWMYTYSREGYTWSEVTSVTGLNPPFSLRVSVSVNTESGQAT